MPTVKEIQSYPDKTQLQEVSLKINKVFERKSLTTKFGPTTIQKAQAEDGTGDRIYVNVWNHDDLAPLAGRHVQVQSNGTGKGLSVKRGSYDKDGQTVQTCELDVNKYGTFHFVEQAHRPQPQNEAPANQGHVGGHSAQNKAVHPATAGAACNKAMDALIAQGKAVSGTSFGDELWRLGSEFVRAAQRLESGDLWDPKVETEKKKEAAYKKLDNTDSNPDLEEVPF